MNTKEANLNIAVVTYACACVAEGDLDALLKLGFERDDLEDLKGLGLTDVPRIGALTGHILKIEVNRDRFARVIAHLKRERMDQEDRDALVERDAPFALLHAVSGISSAEYRGLRKLCDLNGAGRPPEATEAEEQTVWNALQELHRSVDSLRLRDWLDLQERTEVPLRTIYRVARRWSVSESRSQSDHVD